MITVPGPRHCADVAVERLMTKNRCHAESVPCVASLDAFHRAVAEFVVEDLGLVIEPAALAAAGRSLDSSGLLLLGEMHGVRENPLLIRALIQAFGLTSLALEWPDDLAPMIRAFLAGETLRELGCPGSSRTMTSPVRKTTRASGDGPLDAAERHS